MLLARLKPQMESTMNISEVSLRAGGWHGRSLSNALVAGHPATCPFAKLDASALLGQASLFRR